jgi:hypothetical protein
VIDLQLPLKSASLGNHPEIDSAFNLLSNKNANAAQSLRHRLRDRRAIEGKC